MLRVLEATMECQVFVIYLELNEVPITEFIQALHYAIGMEKYVPPKIENILKSLIESGDRMKGIFRDL